MDKIKELQSLTRELSLLMEVSQNPIGDIVVNRGLAATNVFDVLQKMETTLAELEKINNYNLSSSPSPTKKEPHKEMVSHPDHYQGTKIECIDAMLDVFGKEKVSAFCELNAFKYQWRADKKGTDLQDKRKAIWYLDKYVELNKKKQ